MEDKKEEWRGEGGGNEEECRKRRKGEVGRGGEESGTMRIGKRRGGEDVVTLPSHV